MKSRNRLIIAFSVIALAYGGVSLAQDMPSAPPAPAAPMPAPDTADMQTPRGEVTVNSGPAKAPTIGPAPSFQQLSGGSQSITEAQAEAYPPLANDFIHADRNRDGKISKAEYRGWVKQL